MDVLEEFSLAELRAGILYELESAIPVEHKRYSRTIEDAKADYELGNKLYLGQTNKPQLSARNFSACQLLMRIGQYHLYHREFEYARTQDKKNPDETSASKFDWFQKSINELTDLLIQGIESYLKHLNEAESRPFKHLIKRCEIAQVTIPLEPEKKSEQSWETEAQELGKAYIEAWRKNGYEPTVDDTALYIEGVFSNNKIYGARLEVPDREYIKRQALAGITGNPRGFKSKKPKVPTGERGGLPKK